MKIRIMFLFLLFGTSLLFAQGGFDFDTQKNKITIPFQFINNLIVIPIEVNGVPLNFLLDTGVEETILFSIDDTDEISFSNVEKIKIRGYGSLDSFDAYRSVNNKMNIKNYVDLNHTLYLVLDQNINISSQIGIPVNGIIGYHFFKNNMVKIDYESKKITIYKNREKALKKTNKSFDKFPIVLKDGKPFINTTSNFENKEPIESKLLIDIGNSDAIWYFKKANNKISIPTQNFNDYLGHGFSGEVYGKRGRISSFSIGDFKLENPIAAFPDSTATSELEILNDRIGSVCSETMRRFTAVYDYNSNAIYLKKNNHFNDLFNFNMSGIEIQHEGVQWIKQGYEENAAINNNLYTPNGDRIYGNLKYKFELKPLYVITNVRKDSPGDSAGLHKNDIIEEINGRKAYNYSLQEVNDLLKSEEGRSIDFKINRKGVIMKIKIQLKNII